jgi:octaprenyl-diphosphate synthase
MNRFKEIISCLGGDLEEFEVFLMKITGSDQIVIKDILNYVFESKGKRIRPVLVYLTSRLFSEPKVSTHHAALLVEIIHTATLLHDDVIDKALLRRGKPTVNCIWGNKTAILLGDFLFAKAMQIATDNNEYKLFDIITPTVMSLSLGELIQMKSSEVFIINKQKYYEIIKNKTASLLSSCCEAGAYTVNATKSEILDCKKFGEILGYIFQIKDDILDYVGDNGTGKKIGIDIIEKKVTLPLIYAWDSMSECDRKTIVELWDIAGNNSESVQSIIEIVVDNDGILACNNEMQMLKCKALDILAKFDDSYAKLALTALIDFIIDRDK